MMHLFLFDVDSVLVEPTGYLMALQETVAHFACRMGVGKQVPTEEEVRTFEAYAIGSEWDSGPTCVAALLIERLRHEPTLPLPAVWIEALNLLGSRPFELPRFDFGALAIRVGRRLNGRTGAADAARAVLWEETQQIAGLAATTLAALDALLETLLGHTHDFYRAPLTRHFQHLAIGSQAILQTYGVLPDFESPPYLRLYDRPLLAAGTRERIEEAVASERVRVALYTARPSLPPRGVDGVRLGYSPEAELAGDLVEMEDYPLIGMGRMQWLAEQIGQSVSALVKPAPVQGLAAMGAAWSGDERESLEAALALWMDGRLCAPFTGMDRVTVHVFEDAVRGLAAVEGGIRLLQAAGLEVAYCPYGIVSDDDVKRAAMAARGVACYPTVNEAVEAALQHVMN